MQIAFSVFFIIIGVIILSCSKDDGIWGGLLFIFLGVCFICPPLFFVTLGGLVLWGLWKLFMGILDSNAAKKEKQEKEEIERKKEEEREKARRKWEEDKKYYGRWNLIQKNNTIETREKNEATLKNIVKSKLIIDTCIWMDTELDNFFEDIFAVLKRVDKRIILLGDIYEEIVRLRKESGEKGSKARVALKRIAHFTDANLILPMNLQKEAISTAYADKTIIYFYGKENNVTILTHDKELSVRMKLLFNKKQNNNVNQIFDIKATIYADV